MIRSIRHKGLKRFWLRNQPQGIHPQWQAKVADRMRALDAANAPEDLNVTGYYFHQVGERFSVRITANYRLTFGWIDGPVDVDLEDYH